MPRSPVRPALPRAGDPIRSAADALRVVSMAVQRPLAAETIAFFLDESGRSDTITIVSGTTDPDSVVAIAECMGMVGGQVPSLCGLVLATVRPDASGLSPGDVDRWLDAESVAESHGIELVDWFVVTPGGTSCPRELIGEPARW